MSLIFKAPENTYQPEGTTSIFLGGSIENGKAKLWQDEITKKLINKNSNIVIYNPRRENWDATLTNSLDNPVFEEQLNWEFNHLKKADIIFLYFQPGTFSPISLLELGLFSDKSKIVVCCPEGFWRKGNVDFICKKFSIDTIEDIDYLIDYV